MSLPGRQQRALDEIESALEARSPHLTAMFATFTRLTGGEDLTSGERLSRRGVGRLRPGVLVVLPVAAVMAFLAGLLIAVAMGGVAACATATARSAAASRFGACQAPPPNPTGRFGMVPAVPQVRGGDCWSPGPGGSSVVSDRASCPRG